MAGFAETHEEWRKFSATLHCSSFSPVIALVRVSQGDLAPASSGGWVQVSQGDLAPASQGDLAPASQGDWVRVSQGDLARASSGGWVRVSQGDLAAGYVAVHR